MILYGDYLHLECCARIVNLIVTEGMKKMHDSIACNYVCEVLWFEVA